MPSERSKAYTDAGVNIHAGNELVSRIRGLAAKTRIPGVCSDIGGFGGLFRPDLSGMTDPVLVSSTDGVGTKLKLAFAFNKHDTVGIDLVAMSVNDILVLGAKPLFFLDYFATGELDPDCAEAVISGVAEGCRIAGCALLGGETAEMPSMYAKGEYDLAGFCVGIVDKSRIIDGRAIREGDAVIGLASTGPHSNGYSLIRKILDKSGLEADDTLPGGNATICETLLAPTRIYCDVTRPLLEPTTLHGDARMFGDFLHHVRHDRQITGMAHITGGGFYDNISRILPENLRADIVFGRGEVPPVFHWLKKEGMLDWPEMHQIFNCGIGYIVTAPSKIAHDVARFISVMNVPASVIGHIVRREDKDEEQVRMEFPAAHK
jgi:phosphoribosylformylglycinamidine cyclo-ligase